MRQIECFFPFRRPRTYQESQSPSKNRNENPETASCRLRAAPDLPRNRVKCLGSRAALAPFMAMLRLSAFVWRWTLESFNGWLRKNPRWVWAGKTRDYLSFSKWEKSQGKTLLQVFIWRLIFTDLHRTRKSLKNSKGQAADPVRPANVEMKLRAWRLLESHTPFLSADFPLWVVLFASP